MISLENLQLAVTSIIIESNIEHYWILKLLSNSLWEFHLISKCFMQLFINYKEQEAPLPQRS